LRAALREERSGLIPNDLPYSQLPTWIGKVTAADNVNWPEAEKKFHSRNNTLIRLALDQGSLRASITSLKQRYAPHRIGIIVGSSTSSIDRSEQAFRQLTDDGNFLPEFLQPEVLNPHSAGIFLAHLLDLQGPNLTVNTACSSSAKVFANAARWLHTGWVDAVIVGGADALGLSVLHGFHSLQLISSQPCRPFDAQRDGINLGEAAGFAIVMRSEDANSKNPIRLSGYGESSDAYHMSHPHPQGDGARVAIEQALRRAKLSPQQIDYINLHGTASRVNDEIEGQLVAQMFPEATLKSSTKGWTGHTLGAAGFVEAVIAMDALVSGFVPKNLNLDVQDAAINAPLMQHSVTKKLHHTMSNSFGFGGNNAVLIFSHCGT
jgi:3-oxoacyl-[acyl-carrier-protein] synthase I